MATRRKVNNLTALAVLATVHPRPMHRYEIATTMKSRGKDQDMNVKWGSLYTVVDNLEKHGFLEAVGTSRQGNRPERTLYRITDAGVAEMLDWTRELLAAPEGERPRFVAGLSVFMVLPPAEVVALLTTRLAELESRLAGQHDELADHAATVPRLFLLESEYLLAITEAEASWVRSLLDELQAGSFPGLAAWEHYHATGELPAEITDAGRPPG